MTISRDDADLLESIMDEFSANVQKNYSGNALAAFEKNLGFFEKARLAAMKLQLEFNDKAKHPAKHAELVVHFCEAVLPGMKKTFGEDFLIKAMPDKAKDQKVIDLCTGLGAKQLAGLCRKSANP